MVKITNLKYSRVNFEHRRIAIPKTHFFCDPQENLTAKNKPKSDSPSTKLSLNHYININNQIHAQI